MAVGGTLWNGRDAAISVGKKRRRPAGASKTSPATRSEWEKTKWFAVLKKRNKTERFGAVSAKADSAAGPHYCQNRTPTRNVLRCATSIRNASTPTNVSTPRNMAPAVAWA